MIREEEKEGEGKRLEKRVKGRRRLRETKVRRIRGGGEGLQSRRGGGRSETSHATTTTTTTAITTTHKTMWT